MFFDYIFEIFVVFILFFVDLEEELIMWVVRCVVCCFLYEVFKFKEKLKYDFDVFFVKFCLIFNFIKLYIIFFVFVEFFFCVSWINMMLYDYECSVVCGEWIVFIFFFMCSMIWVLGVVVV